MLSSLPPTVSASQTPLEFVEEEVRTCGALLARCMDAALACLRVGLDLVRHVFSCGRSAVDAVFRIGVWLALFGAIIGPTLLYVDLSHTQQSGSYYWFRRGETFTLTPSCSGTGSTFHTKPVLSAYSFVDEGVQGGYSAGSVVPLCAWTPVAPGPAINLSQPLPTTYRFTTCQSQDTRYVFRSIGAFSTETFQVEAGSSLFIDYSWAQLSYARGVIALFTDSNAYATFASSNGTVDVASVATLVESQASGQTQWTFDRPTVVYVVLGAFSVPNIAVYNPYLELTVRWRQYLRQSRTCTAGTDSLVVSNGVAISIQTLPYSAIADDQGVEDPMRLETCQLVRVSVQCQPDQSLLAVFLTGLYLASGLLVWFGHKTCTACRQRHSAPGSGSGSGAGSGSGSGSESTPPPQRPAPVQPVGPPVPVPSSGSSSSSSGSSRRSRSAEHEHRQSRRRRRGQRRRKDGTLEEVEYDEDGTDAISPNGIELAPVPAPVPAPAHVLGPLVPVSAATTTLRPAPVAAVAAAHADSTDDYLMSRGGTVNYD
jgi:hypothetical protein